jgi:hypothetical protein
VGGGAKGKNDTIAAIPAQKPTLPGERVSAASSVRDPVDGLRVRRRVMDPFERCAPGILADLVGAKYRRSEPGPVAVDGASKAVAGGVNLWRKGATLGGAGAVVARAPGGWICALSLAGGAWRRCRGLCASWGRAGRCGAGALASPFLL